MIIPNARLASVIRKRETGFWLENAIGATETVCLVLKIPTTTAKAVVAGCSVELLFVCISVDGESVPCCALGVSDYPDDPLWLYRAFDLQSELDILCAILEGKPFEIHVFDETNKQSLSSRAECYRPVGLPDLASVIGCVPPLSISKETREMALNSFWRGITDRSVSRSDSYLLNLMEPVAPLVVTIEALQGQGTATYLDNPNEGQGLEQLVCRLLYQVFGEAVYISPRVTLGGIQRELTDILVVWRDIVLAFECKATSILDKSKLPPYEKRARMVDKQIDKAISQLVGVYRMLHRNPQVLGSDGHAIDVGHDFKFHAICVASAIEPAWDSSAAMAAMVNALKQARVLAQIIDLRQLSQLSSLGPTPEQFLLFLEGRWIEAFSAANPFIDPGSVPPWLSA